MTDRIHQELQAKLQDARSTTKRTAFYALVAGTGGAITFAAITLPQSPDGIGLFIGAATAATGVGGALVNSVRTMRCLRQPKSNLVVK